MTEQVLALAFAHRSDSSEWVVAEALFPAGCFAVFTALRSGQGWAGARWRCALEGGELGGGFVVAQRGGGGAVLPLAQARGGVMLGAGGAAVALLVAFEALAGAGLDVADEFACALLGPDPADGFLPPVAGWVLQAEGFDAPLRVVGLGERGAFGQVHALDAAEAVSLVSGGERGQPVT